MVSHIDNLIRDLSQYEAKSETVQEFLNKKLEDYDNAIQWNGDNICEIILFTGDNIQYKWKNWSGKLHISDVTIQTPEGIRKVPIGNYIVKTPDGNFCTYKPKKFDRLCNTINN